MTLHDTGYGTGRIGSRTNRAERAAYRSRKREYESSLAVLRDQRAQREQEIESIADPADDDA